MQTAVRLTSDSLPHIVKMMGDDQVHVVWINALFERMSEWRRLGVPQNWYVVKDYKTPGGFTYPYCAFSDEGFAEKFDQFKLGVDF